MPTYFFRVDEPNPRLAGEGALLRDMAEAKCEAVKLAGQILCDEAATFWDRRELSLTVTDESGLTLFQLLVIGTEAAAAGPTRPHIAPS
jgi:hypothetical protein